MQLGAMHSPRISPVGAWSVVVDSHWRTVHMGQHKPAGCCMERRRRVGRLVLAPAHRANERRHRRAIPPAAAALHVNVGWQVQSVGTSCHQTLLSQRLARDAQAFQYVMGEVPPSARPLGNVAAASSQGGGRTSPVQEAAALVCPGSIALSSARGAHISLLNLSSWAWSQACYEQF